MDQGAMKGFTSDGSGSERWIRGQMMDQGISYEAFDGPMDQKAIKVVMDQKATKVKKQSK